jgi:hypothetical protein
MTDKVCIIGAGSSGIATCKVFHQYGIPFDCYEKGSGIGGNWRYANDNGMSSSYRSLHINTSRTMMSYTDYPMPVDYPDYPHHTQILAYFEQYVDHFGFRDKIIFNTAVANVRPDADGSYLVTTDKGETQKYKAVIVANGHHWNPRYPEPAFKGEFKGETIHSHYYKTPDMLQNKNVVVVGIGNSALDIACEAARLNTGKVYLSTRSGAHILPKYIMGVPFDMLGRINMDFLPMWLKRSLLEFNLWIARGPQEKYGVPKPKRRILSEHPSISQDFLSLAGHGKVSVKPNIKEFQGNEVVFEDGTSVQADVVIYCTGYKISFPFFAPDFIDAQKIEQDNEFSLYKRVIQPDYPNLYFVGLCQPLGAIMPLAEIQSQWIAKILTGEVALPGKEFMKKDIQREAKINRKRYQNSKRHTIQVDFLPYKNILQKEMRRMRSGKRIVS